MSERARYSIVVTNNIERERLVVEMTIGEDLVFEIFRDNGKLSLAIYHEYGEPPVLTSADVFMEAIQSAYQDAQSLPEEE